MTTRRALMLTALPLGLVMAGCATVSPPQPAALTLVTFNIWHNQGDWAARRPLLIQSLIEADADVIALEEVLEDANVGLPNQAQTLADALSARGRPYSMHFVSTDPEGAPRRYGNAVLTRLPVLAHDSRKLQPLDDYRTALRVRVEHQGRSVDVVVTHLAWQEDAGAIRERQITDLLSWIPQEGVPLIIMGDFNAPLSDTGLSSLTGVRFFNASLPNSVATTLNPAKGHPNRVIDHIFAETEFFTPGAVSLIGDTPKADEYPSDHFGVRAVLRRR